MNLSATVSDEVTRTTAREEVVIVDPDVASTSTQLMPKKGILKRSSSHGNFPRKYAAERNVTGQFLESTQSPDQFPDRPTTKIPKLTLTWSEKNAVTIYGDTTSDDATTETDDIKVPTIGAISKAEHLPSSGRVVRLNTKLPFTVHKTHDGSHLERQTTILYDDDDDDDDENGDEEMIKNEERNDNGNDDDDDDELAEVNDNDHAKRKSKTDIGNSHISGKWWFGKSTKNIPHCAKWGCIHGHHKDSTDNGGEYLTPTQKRFKEIHQLRKQLKLALAQLEDKDLHLNELRDQLRNLESLVSSANITNGQYRLLHHKESNEDYEREKQKLIDKHEIRVRQLIQEAVEARAEMTKLQIAMKQLEGSRIKIEVKDAEIMTEITDNLSSSINLDSTRMSSSFSPSPQIKNTAEVRVTQIPADLPLQLQAYENEAMAWRMKAAQLEMVLKDQILKTQQSTNTFELDKCRNENERLRTYIRNNIDMNGSYHEMVDSECEANLNFILPTNSIDYCSQQCKECRKQLTDENHHLSEKIEEQNLRLNEYEEDINLLRQTVHSMEEENKKNFLTMEQMSKEIEERTAEVEAANITTVRLQSELAIKTKAICYLEERHQVYRNTILDHNLVIKDESTDDWERGFSDPRYVVNISKRIQTDLTQEMLENNEFKFFNLTDKLEVLKEEFSSKENSMLEHFQEIKKDLLAKNSLVGSLANQLEEADREATRSSELHQKERKAFQEKLYELGQIAENVPLLQFEIEKLQQERSLMEYQLKNVKEEYEAGLDMALAESLKKYQEQNNYWAEKISAANTTNELLRNENIALKRSINELKLRTQVQQADMSKRLASSINHISYLKKQLNRNTRDVQVDVHPRVVSKYVACRPNARHKMTDIEKGELFDEVEERLKLCQGELNSSRQEVAILQKKLVDTVQTQVDDRLLRNKFSPLKVSSTNKELRSSVIIRDDKDSNFTTSSLRDQIEELEKQNHELTMQLLGYKTERQNLLDSQHEQLLHHTSEINNLHKELNQELGRYENERQRLKARIAVLEKVEEERDKLFELLKNKTILEKKCNNNSSSQNSISQTSSSSAHISIVFADDHSKIATDQKIRMKRWTSVPHLFRLSAVGTPTIAVPSNEIITLRERNSILARNNARLNEELTSLKHFIKLSKSYTSNNNDNTSSYKLSSVNEYSSNFDLTADLMQMQEDLENVIIQIDNSAIKNKIDEHSHPNNSTFLNLKEQTSLSSTATNLEHLKIALKKSREEQETLAEQLDRVTLNFQDACRELDLYKHELREDALKYSHDIRLPRSRSFIETGRATVDLDEYLRWKEKAGTMFRELNRIRKEYRACDGERRELRMQLVMLRGELGLAQCQLAEILSNQRRKKAESMSNVSAVSMNDTSSSTLIKRKKLKSRLLSGQSDEFYDAMDSSSGIFFTACNSMFSLNDAMCSISEPELVATKFEGAREYRLSGHNHRDFYLVPAYCHESRLPSSFLDKIQLGPNMHEEIIKEAAKLKIASMSGTISQKKDNPRKDSWKNPKSELLLSSYEKQNVKSKQKLRNLEKQVAEIGEEQAKRTNERSAGQSQEMEILTKKNNEAAEEHPTIYPTTLKKN
ncbi:Protein quick-to-court [Dirofilaria immitis]